MPDYSNCLQLFIDESGKLKLRCPDGTVVGYVSAISSSQELGGVNGLATVQVTLLAATKPWMPA